MVKKILVVLGVLLLLAGIYGVYLYSKPAQVVVNDAPALVLSSQELISKFDISPDVASSLINTIVQVKGTVTLVEQGPVSTILLLDERIKCEVTNEQVDTSITNGVVVTIKGVYSGIDDMFNEIILDKCQLIKK